MKDEGTEATFEVVEALPPTSRTTEDAERGSYRRPVRPPILSPQEVRRLAYDRGRFAWAVAAIIVSSLAASRLFLAHAIGATSRDPNTARELFWVVTLLIHVPAAVFAYRMQALTNRPRLAALLLAALICVPLMKYVVAFFLMRDSRQTLMRHGIRMGLWKVKHGSLPGPAFAAGEGGRVAGRERP